MRRKNCVLTIAGSDSSAGAGIQSDIKTIQNHGLYALTVITSVTAQNTFGVQDCFELPEKIIKKQLESIFNDFNVQVVKTGMLSSGRIVKLVSDYLVHYKNLRVIVDPVILSKNRKPLLDNSGIKILKRYLLPISHVVTPNIHEAEVLSGSEIQNMESLKNAAKKIIDCGVKNVLIKGGHINKRFKINKATDMLYNGRDFKYFTSEYIATKRTHGIGCTFSSALACNIALGYSLNDSTRQAKKYIVRKLKIRLTAGHGHGPVEI
jgi:hydroxymethylpyrimidine/phosphomethylpyrimidine kinase